jgi:hypothetical protein
VQWRADRRWRANLIRLPPPLVITKQQIDRAPGVFGKALQEAAQPEHAAAEVFPRENSGRVACHFRWTPFFHIKPDDRLALCVLLSPRARRNPYDVLQNFANITE